MGKPEVGVGELTDSVIRAGAESGYRITPDDRGGLQITAIGGVPMDRPLKFRFTEEQLRNYYTDAAADAGKAGAAPTEWETWMLLMSTHLGEALYRADSLGVPCEIVIDKGGFWVDVV
ncbi:hypothetical protein [Nocardia sp. NPDC003345]